MGAKSVTPITLFATLPPNTAGHVRLTVLAEGNATAGTDGPGTSAYVSYRWFAGLNTDASSFASYSGSYQGGSWSGTPISSIGAVALNGTFVSGQAFSFEQNAEFGFEAVVGTSQYIFEAGAATASGYLTSRVVRTEVFDDQSAPINFTMQSDTGWGRGDVLAQGAGYAGVSLTNGAPGRFGTTFQIIDGTASHNTDVTATFVAPLEIKAASDVVDLTGTDGDLQVVQESYDPATAAALGPLGYLGLIVAQSQADNSGATRWISAAIANYNGPPPTFRGSNHPYDPTTDFHLGYYGVDSTNHVAWAVINHSSIAGAARNLLSAQAFAPTFFAVGIPFDLVSVVSRKTHGGAGEFDINLPLTGGGVEPRSGGAGGNHTLIFTFKSNLAGGGVSVSGAGATLSGTPTMSGNILTVNLTGVQNQQVATVTLHDMKDVANQVLPDTAINLGFLVGDASGDGTVNSGDATITRNRSGQDVNATNFRADYNLDGFINSADATIVRSRSGNFLPSANGATAPASR